MISYREEEIDAKQSERNFQGIKFLFTTSALNEKMYIHVYGFRAQNPWPVGHQKGNQEKSASSLELHI